MKNIIIFGTGRMYIKDRGYLKDDVFVSALLDNDRGKIGSYIDGVKVYSPTEIMNLEYDAIFLMSVNYYEMRQQLNEYGVQSDKIYDMDQIAKFINYIEIKKVGNYGLSDASSKNIVFFPSSLNTTGANNAFFYFIKTMKENGYNIRVVSRYGDGEILEKLQKIDVPDSI